jgi:hypothetical protein
MPLDAPLMHTDTKRCGEAAMYLEDEEWFSLRVCVIIDANNLLLLRYLRESHTVESFSPLTCPTRPVAPSRCYRVQVPRSKVTTGRRQGGWVQVPGHGAWRRVETRKLSMPPLASGMLRHSIATPSALHRLAAEARVDQRRGPSAHLELLLWPPGASERRGS